MADDNYSFTIQGLLRKRAYVAGDIEATHERLNAMIKELEHLDATIQLFDPNYAAESIKPKTVRPPEDWAHRGEMTRRVMNILRLAAEPLTSREIALQMMIERALNTDDVGLVRLMTKRVGVALRGQRHVGRVRSEQGPGQYMIWCSLEAYGMSWVVESRRFLIN